MFYTMQRDNLREVEYYTAEPKRGFEPEGSIKHISKKGYFHTWGSIPWKSTYDDSFYNRTVAIIEEEDGSITEIPSEWIKFIS